MSGETTGVTIKLSGWQVGIVSTLLVASLTAAFGSWLGMRDWRIRMDSRMEAVEKSTAMPRVEFELREKLIYAEIAQLRSRIEADEARRGQ